MSSKRAWYADYTLQVRDPFAGLPADLVTLVKTELTEGEEILWMEKPEAGFLFRARLLYILCSYLLLSAVTVGPRLVGMFMGRSDKDLLVICILYVTLMPFSLAVNWFAAVTQARRSLYMMTNHRLICFQIPTSYGATSYYFQHQVKPAYIKLKKLGSGRANLFFARNDRGEFGSELGFYGIRRAEEVKQLIEQRLPQNLENPINDLPIRLQPALKAQLIPDEKVLWTSLSSSYWARKRQRAEELKTSGLYFVGGLIVAVVGFAIASFGLIINPLFTWFGLALFLVAGLVIARTLITSSDKEAQAEQEALNAAYVLTDQKLMKVVSNGSQREKLSIYDFSGIKASSRIKRVNHTKNVADLLLLGNTLLFLPQTEFTLIGISEPDKVERLINQLTMSGTL